MSTSSTTSPIPFLEELIRFDSVSKVSNVEITQHVEQKLNDLGLETEITSYFDANGIEKQNLIGRVGTGKNGLAYFCHTDVVPAETWFETEFGPYQPKIVDDKLYGRGSCDMKGSLACFLAAMESIDFSELEHPIYVTCTADEEIGYAGARQLVKNSSFYSEMTGNSPFGIIGEPTSLDVVYAHKGGCMFRVTSQGEAAHSSTDEGHNANLAMIPFLAEMKKIHDETLNDPNWQNADFDPPIISWNIGINDFTSALNIKAAQSICTVMFRQMPGQDGQILLDRAKEIAESMGLHYECLGAATPFRREPNSQYVQTMLKLANQTEPKTVCYGTDGAVFEELENLVVLGPGSIDQAHTKNEFITLNQLEKGTSLYLRAIEHFCVKQV